MTYKEMCQQVGKKHIEVNVFSYGYTVKSIFNSYYEPFKNKRLFSFVLDWFDDDYYWLSAVDNHLIFSNEEDEMFYQDENGEWYCDDPELFMRPSYDE